MAIRNKEFMPDRVYFVTFSIYKWQKVFIDEKYINLVYKWFDYMKDNYGNRIHGYVIMPNHIHLLLYVSEVSPPLSKLIQNGKRFLAYEIVKLLKESKQEKLRKVFSFGANPKKGAKHKVFEDRYDSKEIINPDLFKEKLNYIHKNPCNKGWNLVDDPLEYNYSSASNYYKGFGIYEVEIVW